MAEKVNFRLARGAPAVVLPSTNLVVVVFNSETEISCHALDKAAPAVVGFGIRFALAGHENPILVHKPLYWKRTK